MQNVTVCRWKLSSAKSKSFGGLLKCNPSLGGLIVEHIVSAFLSGST